MSAIPINFSALDKTSLYGEWRDPAKPSKIAALLIHDLGKQGSRDRTLIAIAENLQKMGCASLIIDQRGHGKSQGKQQAISIKDLHIDLDVALHQILDRGYKRVGLVVRGISAAPAVILATTRHNQIHALSLWHPILNLPSIITHPSTQYFQTFSDQAVKDFNEGKDYISMPHISFKFGQEMYNDFTLIHPHLEAQKINRRVMYVYAQDDRIISESEHRMQISHFKLPLIKALPNGDHAFSAKSANDLASSTAKFISTALLENSEPYQ